MIEKTYEEIKYDLIIKRLQERGVEVVDIAKITLDLQKPYLKDMTLEICMDHVNRVLIKREVQNAVLTGIELDVLAEKGLLSEPLSTILMEDYGLYGVDEILALSIVNVYGSIGLTNFGYVDKLKLGIIKELDTKQEGVVRCNTFLDDLVGGVAAAAAGSIAHKYANTTKVLEAYKKAI